jgi:hypothetical protein
MKRLATIAFFLLGFASLSFCEESAFGKAVNNQNLGSIVSEPLNAALEAQVIAKYFNFITFYNINTFLSLTDYFLQRLSAKMAADFLMKLGFDDVDIRQDRFS